MNNKVKYNTYSRNVYNPNNQITGRPINNLNKQPPYDKNKNVYFSGFDLSGTVWLGNPNAPKYYDVATEDPGISWVL